MHPHPRACAPYLTLRACPTCRAPAPARSPKLRHPGLASLYCCSLARRAPTAAEEMVCERCGAGRAGPPSAGCRHGEGGEHERRAWAQHLQRCSSDAAGGDLVVWAVSEASDSPLDTAIRRGWLHCAGAEAGARCPNLPCILHTAHDIATALHFFHTNGLVYGELSGASVALCTGTSIGTTVSGGGSARPFAAKLRSSLHQACRAANAAANRGM